MKLTGYQPPVELMKWFDEIKDSDYLKGGYILGPPSERPHLVVLTCGREVYSCIVAVQQLRKKYSKIRIQLSVINLLNLITSRREEDQRLMSKLIPDKPAILRVTGLPLDTLGTAYGHDQESLGTQYLTQSCTQDELAKDQGYDIESIIKAAERALK
jgi:transketolase